ncbi:NF-kappa-B-activating protein-like [Pyrus ussuriensis x Pyrus communis]|uniref:NF-kappa-B-activating protein-like n=1 Tax=Pyrus ussuriensis x Pyrus communis TaxID=2448454 RepID=A0A5N5FVZ1_9ROSA|nr:NF-kappa-B-activating protein-like [Pyrus ussuriensis x Pyrus communis]
MYKYLRLAAKYGYFQLWTFYSWKLWSAYDTGRSGQYQTYLKLGSPTEYKSRELAFGSQVSCATSTTPIASGGNAVPGISEPGRLIFRFDSETLRPETS